MKLSLVFPTYNEAGSITEVLERFSRYCTLRQLDHEIIIVDDGSRDATDANVAAFARGHKSVRLIRHEKNLGYGGALRSGFAAAKGEYIFFTDSDGQFQPEDLDQTISRLGMQTMVLGYRQPRCEGTIRRCSAWLWGRYVRSVLGFHIRDLNCAWKAFPRAFLTDIKLVANGAFISAELLYYARQKNLMLREIPVHHYARQYGSPTGVNVKVIARAFREVADFRRSHGGG